MAVTGRRPTYNRKMYSGQTYVYGNTVRKPEHYPERREVFAPEKPKKVSRQVRKNRRQAMHMNAAYVVFLAIAAIIALFVCVNYLQLQAETTSRVKHIASLETELEDLRKENNDNYTRIMTSVDLDHIRDVAINELGMVYAEPNQVILYDGGTDDYVRQNGSIPPDYSSMKDKLLGKDGE